MDVIRPDEIEKRSFTIIEQEISERGIEVDDSQKSIVFRVIHTTADFDFAYTLMFSENAAGRLKEAIVAGANICTDTQMARAGIRRKDVQKYGGEVFCYMSDEDVAREAKQRKETRAVVSMEKAAKRPGKLVFAIGNAPTALFRLSELVEEGLRPAFVVGVPVGFVNVEAAKERALDIFRRYEVPYIIARGKKGGSPVAAAVINAVLT